MWEGYVRVFLVYGAIQYVSGTSYATFKPMCVMIGLGSATTSSPKSPLRVDFLVQNTILYAPRMPADPLIRFSGYACSSTKLETQIRRLYTQMQLQESPRPIMTHIGLKVAHDVPLIELPNAREKLKNSNGALPHIVCSSLDSPLSNPL